VSAAMDIQVVLHFISQLPWQLTLWRVGMFYCQHLNFPLVIRLLLGDRTHAHAHAGIVR